MIDVFGGSSCTYLQKQHMFTLQSSDISGLEHNNAILLTKSVQSCKAFQGAYGIDKAHSTEFAN